jgi:hypothetical protein
MSNIVEPQIVETKQSFIDLTKLEGWTGGINPNGMYTNKGSQQIAQQQALQQAQQQALLQAVEQMNKYSNLTDKVFGKQEGWSFERPMRLGAYIIVGAVVGRYVAKNMKKSTTLGMVVGGLAPLLAYKLSIEYDRKNMPKQEPKQPVAIEPTPTPMPNVKKPSLFDNSKYPMECMLRYASQLQPSVVMPPEYWKKREEDWMKTNCK